MKVLFSLTPTSNISFHCVGLEFNDADWKFKYDLGIVPQQTNCYDCGVFVCMYADYLIDDLPLTFTQDNMIHFRQKICADILRGSLLY
jgi:sentrin-specific protease 1